MTSSETQTSDRWAPPGPLIFGGLAFIGWALILYVNQWHAAVPVVMLCLGWVSLLAIGRFLWQSGVSAWIEGDTGDDEGFEVHESQREELLREKKVLLKALRELEFDYQMGKLSVADAESIRQLYRGRAIEIIKQLELLGEDVEGRSVKEQIERELEIRLAVVEAESKGAAAAKSVKVKSKKKKTAAKVPEPETVPANEPADEEAESEA